MPLVVKHENVQDKQKPKTTQQSTALKNDSTVRDNKNKAQQKQVKAPEEQGSRNEDDDSTTNIGDTGKTKVWKGDSSNSETTIPKDTLKPENKNEPQAGPSKVETSKPSCKTCRNDNCRQERFSENIISRVLSYKRYQDKTYYKLKLIGRPSEWAFPCQFPHKFIREFHANKTARGRARKRPPQQNQHRFFEPNEPSVNVAYGGYAQRQEFCSSGMYTSPHNVNSTPPFPHNDDKESMQHKTKETTIFQKGVWFYFLIHNLEGEGRRKKEVYMAKSIGECQVPPDVVDSITNPKQYIPNDRPFYSPELGIHHTNHAHNFYDVSHYPRKDDNLFILRKTRKVRLIHDETQHYLWTYYFDEQGKGKCEFFKVKWII